MKREQILQYHRDYQAKYRARKKEKLGQIMNVSVESASSDDVGEKRTLVEIVTSKNPNAAHYDLSFGSKTDRLKLVIESQYKAIGDSLKLMDQASNTATFESAIDFDKQTLEQVDLFQRVLKDYVKARREAFSLLSNLK